MAINMLDLVKSRLANLPKSTLRSVNLGLSQGDISPNTLPSAYIIPARESAANNARVQGINQTLSVTFAIEIVISNKRADNWVIALEAIRKAIFDQLLNHQLTPNHSAITYSSGQLLSADNDTARWIDEFTTTTQIIK